MHDLIHARQLAGGNANASSDDMLIGAALMLTGTTLTVLGLNGQKFGHMWGEEQEAKGKKKPTTLAKNWRWVLGFAAFFVGQFTEWAAQGFASQEVCVSISNVSLVTNALIAKFFFGEDFNTKPPFGWCTFRLFFGWDLGATVMILSGTVCAVMVAPAFDSADWTLDKLQDATMGTAFLSYIGVTVFATFWCIYQICNSLPKEEAATGKRPARGGFIYAILSALTGSYVVTLSKIVLLIFKNAIAGAGEDGKEFSEPATYVYLVLLAVCAISTLTNLNMGLARYNSLVVLPTYYVFNTVLAIFSGMLFYSTYDLFEGKPDNTFNTGYPGNTVVFGCGASCTLLGVFFLAQREAEAEEAEKDEKNEEGKGAGEAENESTSQDGGAEGSAALERVSSFSDKSDKGREARLKRQSVLGESARRGPVRRRVPIGLLDLESAIYGMGHATDVKSKPAKGMERWKIVTLHGLAVSWVEHFTHAATILCHVPQPGHGGVNSPSAASSSAMYTSTR